MRWRVVGCGSQELAVSGNGGIGLTVLEQRLAEVVVGLRVVGLQAQRPLEDLDCFGQPVCVGQCQPQIVERLGGGGLELDGALERGHGFDGASDRTQRESQVAVGARVVGLVSYELTVLDDGGLGFAVAEQLVGPRKGDLSTGLDLHDREDRHPDRDVRQVAASWRERGADGGRIHAPQHVRSWQEVDALDQQVQDGHRKQLVVVGRRPDLFEQSEENHDPESVQHAEQDSPELGAR